MYDTSSRMGAFFISGPVDHPTSSWNDDGGRGVRWSLMWLMLLKDVIPVRMQFVVHRFRLVQDSCMMVGAVSVFFRVLKLIFETCQMERSKLSF